MSSSMQEYKLDQATVTSFLTLLKSNLPYTLSLYRRLQFQHFSPAARIVSSISPSTAATRPQHDTQQWIIAYVDRSRRPETEIFLASSWENNISTYETIKDDKAIKSLVTDLVASVASLSDHQSEEASSMPQPTSGPNIYTAHLSSPSLVLFGAVHHTTACVIRDLGLLSSDTIEKDGLPEAYHRWVFPLHDAPISSDIFTLADGLVYGELRERDFGTVRARTSIPRQDRTLRTLARIAGYDRTNEDVPVAWAFLGVDGSLSTLHVEKEYRGKGVARAVAVRLWEKELKSFTGMEGGERWASADVATYNRESNAVCKGLGGEVAYIDYWLRVDVNKVH